MEKLIDRTLRRQLAEQSAQIAELTATVKQVALNVSASGNGGPSAIVASTGASVQTAQAINNGVVNNNTTLVAIVPWDSERRLNVTTAQIARAFAENPMLREYMRLPEHEMTDPELAPPYVTELFMDLVRRGHSDPSARNVYLNPRRADQALVHMKTGKWEIVPAANATRLLMDGVAQTIHQVVLTDAERKQLPTDAQNALSLAGMVYEDEPGEYVKRVRAPMAAHLANIAPAKLAQLTQ